ncbi:MAG: carbohydrate ABC transporter permease [Armatimonadota bacterium]|nr:carbohydrate ABC transporter permease [Armatimonadota bacterium]MDR7489229.1 carbohydrate ABC transporter permease [Armatimonadota bacterium]MDR7492080.1 carbohydrate ABC transporter permease [Armatimonadota bacterium]MDR7528835.1 carbohydrate ABC transporter permease [Armatimonadota bacterium]MDR7586296.1 carbohydrate ABC transporter permease [Armatimonadota bacterium]
MIASALLRPRVAVRLRHGVVEGLKYAAAALVLVLVAFPLYGLMLTSIQSEQDIRSPHVRFIPRYVLLEHYREVLKPGHIVPIQESMTNSFLVSLGTALTTVALAVPATYAITRLRLPGRQLILGTLVSIYLFPTLLFVLPLYVKAVQFRLVDTYLGLLIPYTTWSLPVTIWILKGFLEAVPIEVEEAARIDGANLAQLLTRIVLPLMQPGILAGLLMVFIFAWVEFLTPLLFSRELKILTVALGLYRSTYDIKIGQLAAAAVLTALPVIALTAVFQRTIAQVITVGAER